MIRDVLDTHSHTMVSGHAYSTLREMAEGAARNGMDLLAITDHAPSMPGGPHEFYFINFKVIHHASFPVKLLMGVEASIMNTDGKLDLRQGILEKMDIVIASLHIPCMAPKSREENTKAVLAAMSNPCVDVIGHPDDERYPLDYEAVVEGAARYHVLLEVNNSSFSPDNSREGARENYCTMLELCRKMRVPVIMGSDAHIDADAGNHREAKKLLEEIDFPEELVMNRSVEGFLTFLEEKRNARF